MRLGRDQIGRSCLLLVTGPSSRKAHKMETLTLDLDEQALTRKKRPWGRFVAGIFAALLAGGVVAAYVPLYRAHRALLGEYEPLAKKAQALSLACSSLKERWEAAEAEHVRLALELGRGKALADERKKAAEDLHSRAAAGLKLTALVIGVEPDDLGAQVRIDPSKAFASGGRVSPGLIRELCRKTEKGVPLPDAQLEVHVGTPLVGPAPGHAKLLGEGGAQASEFLANLIAACKYPRHKASASVVPLGASEAPTLTLLSP